jgi:molybdopterin-guanine dinucleotide biosynthesis protein A
MTPDPIFTAAILAGGRARRLGGTDKSALLVGGRSILERQLDVLRHLTPHIRLVAREAQQYRDTGVPVLQDCLAEAGPLGGLYTALVDSPTEHVLVIACDMPFLTAAFLARLVHFAPTADAVVPRDARGLHPLCAVYNVHLAGQLRDRIDAGTLSVRGALAGFSVRDIGPEELTSFDPDGRLLLNVNTPEDYARACAAAESPRAPV